MNAYPTPIAVLSSIRRPLVSIQAYLEGKRYALTYSAPVRPLELFSINPRRISTRLNPSSFLYDTPWMCIVADGDWDRNTILWEEYDLVRSFRAHFEKGIPWEDTAFYRRVKANIESDPNWSKWNCQSLQDFERRCERLDELYTDIAMNGYRSQRDLVLRGGDNIYEGSRSLPPELYEVTVHIDRDGEFIFHEGRHRLAIAQILDLESIPVRVMARHREWQRYRDEVYAEEASAIEHPDLDFQR